MRKLYHWSVLIITIIALLPAGLYAQERNASNSNSGANEHSPIARETHVTPAQALNVGYTFMRTGTGTRGAGTRSSDVRKQAMQLIYTGKAVDSTTRAVTDCYYVFSLQPQGFVIVAADDRVEPILGYSYDNNFVVENMPDHVRGWLGNYEKQIETVVKQNIAPVAETTTKWSRLKAGQSMSTRSGGSVGPLLTTQWDQEWPYNALCPNDGQGNFTLTGCIATMMAQLMKYWDWPKRGTGFTSYQTWQFGEISADFGNTEYNWDNMPNFLDSLNTDVALLLYHCGIAVNMEYGFNESSTYPSRVQEALTSNFQYSHKLSWNWLDGSSDYIRESIRHQLDMYQPVHYSASNHSYIVDGYQNEMFHFNMGWGGYFDGYYMICPNEENAFYQNAPSATINIRPDKPIYMLHALDIDTFSTTLVTSTQTEEIFTTSDYLVWLNDQLPPITVPAIETSFDANEPILYTSSLHGLRPNTTYTFCVKLSNEYYQFTDDTLHFSTVDIDDLSAYPPLIFYDTVYVCSGETWKGRTVPGDYSDTVLFNNSPSINYIIHSHLIINNEIPNITLSDSVITSCSGEQILMVASGASQYTWDNGLLPKDSVFVIADHDTIFRVIGETNGCLSYDSVIVSVLAVNKNKQVITMLPNDTIIFGNFVITEPGIYYDSVPSVNGCYDINELIVKKPLFSGGNGSVESPFLISCKEDLEIMADAIINDNSWDIGKHFLVVQDILDTVRSPLGIFRGFFHGGGHKIVLGIRSFQPNPLGLFIKIDEGASVDSVILEGYVIGSDNSGGIAVSNDGLITHCVNKANIMGVGGCGGIAATSELGEISYCSNAGSIRGGDGVGGICGSVISSNQTHHCSNIGNVYASRQGACGVGPSYYSINAGIVASEFADAGAGGTYSIEVGPNLFIPSGVRFYYDNQICRSSQPDIADNIEGKHGEALIDNGLSSIFANRFVYNSGMYPIPKGMENDSITVLAATPVIFEKTDNRLSIKHPFFVHNGNGVSWSSKLGKVQFLNNGKVIQNTLGEDTLIAQYGSFRKSIPIDIACIPTEDSLFYSDCSSVTYNGLVFYHDTIFNDSVENQLGEIDFKTILIEILSKKTILEVPLSQNENYNFHGTTLTESGIYTDTLQTVSGCDSIVILNLTFNLSPYSGGNGTFISPYIIANLSDFQQLIDNIHTFGEDYSSGKYFLQTSNITDSVRNTLPTFKGYYDGDGHSIRIAISNGGSLFGTVYGSIHNLTLYGYYYAPPYDHVGCFASYLYGNITNCVNYCDIIGTCESGGIASWLYDYSRIERCSNYGSITGYVAGGIAAQSMFRAVVTECANSGVISSSNYKAGGIVGINNAGATVSKCINTGTIYGNVMSGGIVAENTGVINHCFNSGLITGPQINGGISATHGTMLDASTTGGYVEGWPVNINGCINVGNISSSNSFGSICGIVDNHDTTNLSYNYYDCQWSHAKGFNNSDVFGRAEPMHTHEMINGNISGLFDTCWTFMTNKYPLLKDLYLDSICQVAAMPVLLDASNKSDSITLPFLILGTSECSYSSMYDKVLLDGETGLGTLLFSGQDTLVLQYGNNKKTLPINITNIPAIASTHVWTGCDSVLVDNKCFYGDSIWSTVDTSNNNINIVVTNIVLLKSFISETSVAINEGDSVFFRGRFLHNAGIYYDSLVSTIGCDSIYKITVSVNKKRIIYVKESGTGDGSSWVDAFGDIQLAVNIAGEIGGMVWIAAGTYTGFGITVPDGVAIYGGFYGNEPETYNITKRNLATNISIITGQAISIGNGSLIDGFTIKDIYSEKCINGGQLYNCRITECRCTTPYSGWGVVCDSYLFNCILDRNHNSILYRCSAFNCTFANNTSDTYMMYDASLTNCINWNNSGRHYGCVVSFSAIDKNITLDGIGVVVLDDEDDGINPTSNYVRFMDPYNGDYRLSAGSVCINTGDPNVEAFGLPSTDLQGWPRVLLGRIDIGAFEYYPIPMMETYDTICEGNSVVFFDSTCTAEGSYVHHTHAEDVTLDTLYVLHLTVNQSTYGDTSAVACESFSWNGNTYTQSGDYTQTFTNLAGCDSVVTLHLTVNYSNTGDTTAVACENFTWQGTTYTESGSYSAYQTNANGCDSVITLHLTINQTVSTTITETACESFTWNGNTYTQSGDYPLTLTAANGCDSVVTLHLTVNQPVSTTITETACESYTWNGETYTQSGDYPLTLTAANGCDSVVTLHLTVNHSNTGDTTAVACESFTWQCTTYTESGSYSSYQTTAAGCDSIVTLHLTINQPVNTTITETACESHTWNGNTYTQSGDYPLTLTAANGCDSVVTLHLTIFEDETSEFSITTSDSCYSWNNIDYCASGDYTQTLQTIHGCDSVVTLHLTITVGIDDYNGFDFKVYPNPTSNIVNVECIMKNEEWGEVELHLCDAYGRLLGVVETHGRASLQTVQIDLSRYANGIYFVKAVADGETVAVRKVVKK